MALVLFTGGARSGKSHAAEDLAKSRERDGGHVAVVVFGREGVDAEFTERVRHHRARRPDGWDTIEVADCTQWHNRIPDDSLVVVDCLGTLLGLCMESAFTAADAGELGDAHPNRLPAGFEEAISELLDVTVNWLVARHGDTIVVTNEVGDGIVPSHATGRAFRDVLGRANRRLSDRADAAYLCVAGRLVALHTLDREVRWPED